LNTRTPTAPGRSGRTRARHALEHCSCCVPHRNTGEGGERHQAGPWEDGIGGDNVRVRGPARCQAVGTLATRQPCSIPSIRSIPATETG
jgi:hypothetical protein